MGARACVIVCFYRACADFESSVHASQTAIPFLVGTKYDHFATFPKEEQEEITKQVSVPARQQKFRPQDYLTQRLPFPFSHVRTQARRFARAMKAPLIFCSTSHSINVQKIFKVRFSSARARRTLRARDITSEMLTFLRFRGQQIILSKAFDLKCTIPEIKGVGEPLLIYVSRRWQAASSHFFVHVLIFILIRAISNGTG